MRRAAAGTLLLAVSLSACNNDPTYLVDAPAEPRALYASYYAGAITVEWELAPGWNGEPIGTHTYRTPGAHQFTARMQIHLRTGQHPVHIKGKRFHLLKSFLEIGHDK